MIRKILEIRNPKLREKSKPVQSVDKKLKQLLQDLCDTIEAQKDPEGVGLAAPQIGQLRRVFVVKYKKQTLHFVNPKIVWFSKKTNESMAQKKGVKRGKEMPYYLEGCLSLPHYYGPVRRAQSVRVKFQVLSSGTLVEKEEKFTGFVAQVIQHEVDHLDGILFIDRLLAQKRNLYQLHDNHWDEVELLP